MAQVIVNDTSLTAIANAIRAKNGSNDTYTPSEMATAIGNISGGDGGASIDLTQMSNTISGENLNFLQYYFILTKDDMIYLDRHLKRSNNYNSFFANMGPVQDLTAFYVDLRYPTSQTDNLIFNGMFTNGTQLKFLPIFSFNANSINDVGYLEDQLQSKISFNSIFSTCRRLQNIPYESSPWAVIPEKFWDNLHNDTGAYTQSMFTNCNSLRSIDPRILKKTWSLTKQAANNPFQLNSYFGTNLYCLQKIEGLFPTPIQMTTNYFPAKNSFISSNCAFYSCSDLIFATDDNNNPYVRNYKNQYLCIPLSKFGSAFTTVSYLPAEKEVTDATSYEALKNDPGWWSVQGGYCKYNHDSAVRTINSLPDTSAYLLSQNDGSTNTIEFYSSFNACINTDYDGPSDLTAAEIAVATNKGWTVVFN